MALAANCKKAETILLNCVEEIAAGKNFDDLHGISKSKLNISGANNMFWHGTAFRIGIRHGNYPEKVYLHISSVLDGNARDGKSTKTQRLKTEMRLRQLIYLDNLRFYPLE